MLRLAILWLIITAILKLTGVVAWSWWVIVGPAAVLVVLALLLIVGGLGILLRMASGPRKR